MNMQGHWLLAATAKDAESWLWWLNDSEQVPAVSMAEGGRAEHLTKTERFPTMEGTIADQLKELKKEAMHLHSGHLELIVDGMDADAQKQFRKQREAR